MKRIKPSSTPHREEKKNSNLKWIKIIITFLIARRLAEKKKVNQSREEKKKHEPRDFPHFNIPYSFPSFREDKKYKKNNFQFSLEMKFHFIKKFLVVWMQKWIQRVFGYYECFDYAILLVSTNFIVSICLRMKASIIFACFIHLHRLLFSLSFSKFPSDLFSFSKFQLQRH